MGPNQQQQQQQKETKVNQITKRNEKSLHGKMAQTKKETKIRGTISSVPSVEEHKKIT